jgi:uncharacterized protein (TIGR02444 family)
MDEPKNTAAEEAFWGFSLAFYERPEVAEALITLQDRDGFDVNVILFALWIGLSGRGVLFGDLLTAALREAAALRTEIVEPLREFRRKLRNHPDKNVQQLRKGVKALELAGERLVQRRLAWLAGSANADASPELRQAAARTNLALYLGAAAAPGREAAAIFQALDAFAGIPSPRL